MPRLQRIPVRAATTYVWLPCLLAALILYTRDGLAYPAPTGFATVWVAHACMLACLALSWDETTGYRGRAFWARPALCVAAVFGTGLSVGLEPLRCLALGLANLATALVAFWVYRFRGLGRSWVPQHPPEAAWLMVALLVAVPVGALLGAFPGVPAGGQSPPALLLWSLARYVAPLAVVMNCALPLMCAASSTRLRFRWRRWLAPYLLLSIPALVAPFVLPGTPATWLALLPAVGAGLLMTRRWAAACTLLICVIAALPDYPSTLHRVLIGGILPPEAIIDLAVAFLAHVAMLLVVFRERQAELWADISARASAERSHNELLGAVLRSMSDGMVLADRDGRVTMSNDSARTVFGRPLPEVVDLDWARSIDLQADQAGRILDRPELAAILRPREARPVETSVFLPAAGRARRLKVTSLAIDMGAEDLTLLLVKDVSADDARQRELEAFAGTVAHDLKGPLAALSGWMDAADEELDRADPASVRHALDRAQGAARRMAGLIEDYLARSVTRGGVLTLTAVPLLDVVQETIEVYADRRGPDAVTFEVDTPHVLRADASLMRQLMANLIGNAIKYGREGESVFVRVDSVDHDLGWALVRVADRGRGLTPGDEQRIFEMFSRSEKDVDGVAGTGLGLALCRTIVARHGGSIAAATNEWGGATFSFTVPALGRRP